MGAWIEIFISVSSPVILRLSLPTWERGLKLYRISAVAVVGGVAPYMGAWIEIAMAFC